MKYGIGEDAETHEFLIMHNDKHVIFARGSDRKLLQEFCDDENNHQDEIKSLQTELTRVKSERDAKINESKWFAAAMCNYCNMDTIQKITSWTIKNRDKDFSTSCRPTTKPPIDSGFDVTPEPPKVKVPFKTWKGDPRIADVIVPTEPPKEQ